MNLFPVVTDIFHLGENLHAFILKALEKHPLKERSILAVTSKIVSLSESRVEPLANGLDKVELVKREADYYLGEGAYGTHLTIKEGLFIASSGIDVSNAEKEFYILYPKDPYQSAKNLYLFLKKEFQLSELGILITDSHTQPLRRGVTGVGLAYWGFRGVKNMVGEDDLFQKPLKFTCVNVLDALASSACFMMGEGNERSPLVLIYEAPVSFLEKESESDRKSLSIPPEEDLYFPFYKHRL